MTLMGRASFLILSSLMASCTARYSPVFWGWREWVDPGLGTDESHLAATLDWATLPGVVTLIDGKDVGSGYKRGRLLPGQHAIAYAYYPSEFGAHPSGTIELHVSPGHSYEFKIDLCFWCSPRRYATWVEDKTTNALVWGTRPDWSSWHF
jgi:hypothetical protein